MYGNHLSSVAVCRIVLSAATILCIAGHVASSIAAEPDRSDTLYSAGRDNGVAIRVWIPFGSEPIRGLFIWGNGAGGDSRSQVMDRRWQAFCRFHRFAFVATSRFGFDMRGSEGKLLLRQITDLAKQSGHPELRTAPVVFSGHSNGGQMAWEFNAAYPERTIAISISKGGNYRTYTGLPAMAYKTPMFFVIGGQDEPRRATAISRLFAAGRSKGAPWAIAVEPGVGHSLGHSEEVWLPFFAWAIEARVPHDSPMDKPVTLRDVDLTAGWLVDHGGGAGSLSAGPAAKLQDRPLLNTSWLPNAALAFAYLGLATVDRPLKITADTDARVMPVDGAMQLRIAEWGDGPWTRVQLWVDGQAVKEVTPDDPELILQPDRSGVHSVVAMGTRNDGTTGLSPPLAWVVEANEL